MNQIERLYKIEQLLSGGRVVPTETILARLEVSRATFKRDLDYLRDRLNAPIVWDRRAGGYRWGQAERTGPRYQLPGLWFNSSEAYALLAMQQLLEQIEPGLLAGQVAPLMGRLRALIGAAQHDADEVAGRIRIVQSGARRGNARHFASVAKAVLARRRAEIRYFSRGAGEETERVISPQRLVNYRGTWYVDAWCHLRNDLRSFAVDGIRRAGVLRERARAVSEQDMRAYFDTSYGIFRGQASKLARLRFTPKRALWVANEIWHPQQNGRLEADGSYLLEIPYHHDQELAMDVLRHGGDVEVLAPAELRAAIHRQAKAIEKRSRPLAEL